MAIWTWMVKQVRAWKLEDYAEDIAIRAMELVWNQVASRVGHMSLAEARGYIRARSALILSRETREVVAQTNGLDSHQARLVELATDVLICRLERRVFESQRLVLPRRRAA